MTLNLASLPDITWAKGKNHRLKCNPAAHGLIQDLFLCHSILDDIGLSDQVGYVKRSLKWHLYSFSGHEGWLEVHHSRYYHGQCCCDPNSFICLLTRSKNLNPCVLVCLGCHIRIPQYSHISGSWNPKIKVLADSASGESLPPRSHTSPSCCGFTRQRGLGSSLEPGL